jgi:polar amino acid transport system substrate-binding protein
MTTKRRRYLVSALGLAGAIALAGCTGSTGDPAPTASATTAAPPAPAAAARECRDGQPDVASLAPGSISLRPASWGAGSTMAAIRRRGHLILGTSGDSALWGARNPATGKIEGFDVDVALRVARALGLDPDDTVYKVLTIAQRVPALQEKKVDLVAERMTITCDRWQGTAKAPKAYINMSTAYYISGARFLVRTDSGAEDLANLTGQTVCGVEASTSLAALEQTIAAKKLDIKRVVAAEPGKCLVKFQEGEATAVVGDDTTLAGLASQDPYSKIVGTRLNASPVGLGLHAEATDFTRFVNVVLEQMRADGSLAKLYDKWMQPTLKNQPAPAVPKAVYGRDIDALKRQP